MDSSTLVDDFGRRTVFTGEKLVEESTDSPAKPQWVVVEVWRTEAGAFVVRRTTHYRILHLSPVCEKADGYDLSPATAEDNYTCRHCGRTTGAFSGGYRQDDRVAIDVYNDPAALILGFQAEGRFTTLSRSILADIAEADARVDAAWNTVIVP